MTDPRRTPPDTPPVTPATEPRTEAGRRLWKALGRYPLEGPGAMWVHAILAIEAEAAQGAEEGVDDVWHYCDFDSPHHLAAQGAAPRAEGLDE